MSQPILDTLHSHHMNGIWIIPFCSQPWSRSSTIYLAVHFLHWISEDNRISVFGCLWRILQCGTPKNISYWISGFLNLQACALMLELPHMNNTKFQNLGGFTNQVWQSHDRTQSSKTLKRPRHAARFRKTCSVDLSMSKGVLLFLAGSVWEYDIKTLILFIRRGSWCKLLRSQKICLETIHSNMDVIGHHHHVKIPRRKRKVTTSDHRKGSALNHTELIW